MTRVVRRLCAAGLAAAIPIGCAGGPRDERTVLAGSAAKTLLILPLNVTAVMPPELEASSAAVWDELAAYLEEQGAQLKTANFRDARTLWLQSIRKARAGEKGAEAGFDDAARAFVLSLARRAAFDTVIMPSLFVREAIIEGRSARWDGVTRPVEVEARGLQAKRIAANTDLEGVAPAASLHVVVLDARGNKLHESLRGLELLVRVRVQGNDSNGAAEPQAGAGANSGPNGQFEFAARTDLFEDREQVRQTISEALALLLPPPPPSP